MASKRSLLDWLFPEEEEVKNEQIAKTEFKMLTGYRPVFKTHTGSIYESALIRSAVEAKARHISKLKVEFQGPAQPQLKNRLKYYPNPWQTWPQFLARCSTILDCTNNLFIVPVQDDYFQTIGFFPVLPDRVTLLEDKKGNLWVRYKFVNGQTGTIEFNRCAFLNKHQYRNDLFGDSNKVLKQTLDLITIQDQAIEEAVKNSATIKFIAQVDNFTSPEDLRNERKRFNEYNLKDDRSELLLFPYSYKDIKQVNVSPFTVDEKQSELIKNNVFDYFGVSEKIIQSTANNEEQDAFFNSEIEPFAIALREAMSRAVYTDNERAYGNHCYVNPSRLQYMTISEKVNMAQQLGDRGALTINEIRELFNYPPLPSEEGDVAFIRGEYYAVSDKLGETPAPTETAATEA